MNMYVCMRLIVLRLIKKNVHSYFSRTQERSLLRFSTLIGYDIGWYTHKVVLVRETPICFCLYYKMSSLVTQINFEKNVTDYPTAMRCYDIVFQR